MPHVLQLTQWEKHTPHSEHINEPLNWCYIDVFFVCSSTAAAGATGHIAVSIAGYSIDDWTVEVFR